MGESLLVVLVAFDDLSEGDGVCDTRDLNLNAFVGICIRNDDHVPSFDSRNPVALIADGFDLDGSVIALGNWRVGLSGRLRRLSVDVSIRVSLLSSLWNNSDAIRDVRLEVSEFYLVFGISIL